MGDLVELIFGLAMLGFILFMVIGIPMTIIADSKKPKTRKSRSKKPTLYNSKQYSANSFDYYHESDKSEFLVYFIANEKLGALKVGVGNFGRLKQLLESYESKDLNSPNIGWEVLKVGKFSTSSNNFESGKLSGEEAEKRAHYYWRYVLKQPLYLHDYQMGFSRITKNDKTMWVSTPGYTETVSMREVCEVSTWNFVKNSPGFLEEMDLSNYYICRNLRLSIADHSILDMPPEYKEFKLVTVNHYNPKATELRRSSSADNIYGEKRKTASEPAPKATKVYKEPAPYTGGGIGVYPCLTSNCPWPSSSMFESTYCQKCEKPNE
jgi:hypothetical protein